MAETYKLSLAAESPPRAALPQIPRKPGRVKVTLRCRPPFEDELEEDGTFQPVVGVTSVGRVNKISLTGDAAGKAREFYFDHVFGPTASQDQVYDTMASPVVNDVLQGFNGTILAYGQTGTGKTYTMGILERVRTERAGIIPRALAQVFSHVSSHPDSTWTVTMSFLQIYLETIQDLLRPPSPERADENLALREDPRSGFYVAGLQEYPVRNYAEAAELLNWGLSNRIMASTHMNITSSRSHTVLCLAVTQRQEGGDEGAAPAPGGPRFSRTLRSKLMLVDLAGSERVRRTSSSGARLVEAKAINSSLSALGNVIAALADSRATHVPYRDSKLTRLLQDSLGGTASTVLVATLGPAAVNASESLSTLQFASRCMHVKSTPVLNEELDYASMVARLQARLATVEREIVQRETRVREEYEATMASLNDQLADAQARAQTAEQRARESAALAVASPAEHPQLDAMGDGGFDQLAGVDGGAGMGGDAASLPQQEALLRTCYEALRLLLALTIEPSRRNFLREAARRRRWDGALAADAEEAERALYERARMAHFDPQAQGEGGAARASAASPEVSPSRSSTPSGGGTAQRPSEGPAGPAGLAGPHLRPLSYGEARKRVARRARSNNTLAAGTTSPEEQGARVLPSMLLAPFTPALPPSLRVSSRAPPVPEAALEEGEGGEDDDGSGGDGLVATIMGSAEEMAHALLPPWEAVQHRGPQAVAEAVAYARMAAASNAAFLDLLLRTKDVHFDALREEQVAQTTERRQREEEVINWSFVLKYLLSTNSALRTQLRAAYVGAAAGDVHSTPARATAAAFDAGAAGPMHPLMAAHATPAAAMAPGSVEAPPPDLAGPGQGSPGDGGDGLGRLAERLARRTARADAAAAPIAHPSESSPTQQLAAATPLPSMGQMPAEGPPPHATAAASGEGEEEEEEEGEGDVVEAIVDGRVRDEEVELKVHWQGSFPSEDEWFPRDPLVSAYPALVAAYEAALAGRLGFEEPATDTVEGAGPIFGPAAALRLHALADERREAAAGAANGAAELPNPQVAIAQLRYAAHLDQRRAPEDADFDHARNAVSEAHHAVNSLKLRVESSNGDAEGDGGVEGDGAAAADTAATQAGAAEDGYSQI